MIVVGGKEEGIVGGCSLLGQSLPAAFLVLDVPLHFRPDPPKRDDLCGRSAQQGIREDGCASSGLQKGTDSVQVLDWVEVEQLLNGRGGCIHEKIDELAILRAHLIRIHDFVSSSCLENFLHTGFQFLDKTIHHKV